MQYKLSGFGKDSKGWFVTEWRYGLAVKGEPSIVTKIKVFKDQESRDVYIIDRDYI